MGVLKRISIKSFLMGLIAVLVLILAAQSANNVFKSYKWSHEMQRVDYANEMADHILVAAGQEAIERGVGATILSSENAADPGVQRLLENIRAAGDEALDRVYELAEELVVLDPSNTAFAGAFKRVQGLKKELDEKRRAVDTKAAGGSTALGTAEWIKLMTGFIEANADMRLAAHSSHASEETYQEALRMNLELKQALWLVSEYAGRERATLGGFIASKTPLDPEVREKLNTFRAIVELNMKTVLNLKNAGATDPEVLRNITAMEDRFLGSFEQVRSSVYAAAATGNYPVSGKQWIEQSTNAINTILGVSAALGQAVDDKVMPELAAAKRQMVISLAFLAFIIAIGAGSFWVINSKVISPMHYLSDTMNRMEETGDLTAKIEVDSEDESGQMASTFNKMVEKFHNIIQQIHFSSEHLASASEELSASAVQIANGSQEQSSKASQVSTASQEMSATLIEVVRNISSAAEAAKEANTVAVKGGEIVSSTIESMNGIASTAKESSEIISTLGNRSQEIGNIINVIEDIADQTNLLALNAAIEAARAGEQGRGFAVVADEVRKLAEKTMTATKEIGGMIKTIQNETSKAISSTENEVKAVEAGVALATDAGAALQDIVSRVEVVTSMIYQVTTASEQQSAATDQISGDIEDVARVIGETSASSQQIAQASQEIAELTTNLKSAVDMFKISGVSKKGALEPKSAAGTKSAQNLVHFERKAG